MLTGDSGCLPVKQIGLGCDSHTSLCRYIRQPGTRCWVPCKVPRDILEIEREGEWTWRTWKLKGKMCPPSLYLPPFHTPSFFLLLLPSSFCPSFFPSFLSFFSFPLFLLLLSLFSFPLLTFFPILFLSVFSSSPSLLSKDVLGHLPGSVGSQLEWNFGALSGSSSSYQGAFLYCVAFPCSFLHQYIEQLPLEKKG